MRLPTFGTEMLPLFTASGVRVGAVVTSWVLVLITAPACCINPVGLAVVVGVAPGVSVAPGVGVPVADGVAVPETMLAGTTNQPAS